MMNHFIEELKNLCPILNGFTSICVFIVGKKIFNCAYYGLRSFHNAEIKNIFDIKYFTTITGNLRIHWIYVNTRSFENIENEIHKSLCVFNPAHATFITKGIGIEQNINKICLISKSRPFKQGKYYTSIKLNILDITKRTNLVDEFIDYTAEMPGFTSSAIFYKNQTENQESILKLLKNTKNVAADTLSFKMLEAFNRFKVDIIPFIIITTKYTLKNIDIEEKVSTYTVSGVFMTVIIDNYLDHNSKNSYITIS